MTSETKLHETPNGGDRSVINYRDDDGDPIDKSKAVMAEVIEYKGDVEIQRTYARIG